MFSNKIDTFAPVKDDKLKSQANQNFDFEGEGFSSMLEKDETLTGKLRETEAEIMEDESILSTDEENRAIAKRNTERAKAEQAKSNNIEKSEKPEADARNLLKLMDISTKANMHSINISKSKKELENITGAAVDEPEALTDIVTKVMQGATDKHEEEAIETTIDLSTSEEKMSDSDGNNKDDTLHETAEELLEDASILSTDEENLAMINKNKEYKSLTDEDYSKNGVKDMELLDEIKSIHNQSQVEISPERKIKTAEAVMAQVIEESKSKIVRLNAAELSSNDVDYIISLLKEGTADSDMNENKNPSALSAKFLAMLKDALMNKKIFRIDFDNEISVIIKINVEGKISANFLTSSKELEEGLKNNLYLLREKFEQQGIQYESIEYTKTDESISEFDIEKVLETISTVKDTQTQH